MQSDKSSDAQCDAQYNTQCNKNSGKIVLITGPMGAGKTDALLRFVSRAEAIGKRVKIYKYAGDTRYGCHTIVTHTGRTTMIPAELVTDMAGRENDCVDYDSIVIDEAQFVKNVGEFAHTVALAGKNVYIGCLISDYRRLPFSNFAELCMVASKIKHITALCKVCGKTAMFTKATTTMREVEKIGGMESYMPVCRDHYH